ncbi:MAG TPA: 1,4-dihydroxy-6-naphthoate synthase [Flavisolibacter sp.]|nr:1,4-dihydroxy-6-naphthoate synthase [Flavisolibacter sp.]
MKFTLGFSPCPNDTFIFDALVNRKIDTEGFEFEVRLEDIQTLNEMAASDELDLTKLSFPAFFRNAEKYDMLQSGAAMGKGVGPLLVARRMVDVPDLAHSRIAIPGELTTANFLLHFAFPAAKQRIPMLFSSIEDAVLNGEADLGVIIHENRFTYHQRGLIKVCDLGEVWEEKQKAPIPLACIAAKKTVPPEVQGRISALIRKSVEYAFSNYPAITDYTKTHAQAMDESVMRQHIELYVNEYSLELGENGHKAIEQFRKIFSSVRS